MTAVRLVEREEFEAMFPQPPTIYDSPAFLRLNAPKAQSVAYAVGQGISQVFGLVGGQWRAPYSAPYSAPSGTATPEALTAFYTALPALLGGEVKVTLPPAALWDARPQAEPLFEEVNHHYPLGRVADYRRHLSAAAKNKLNQALRHPFVFEKTTDIARAYEVIRINRQTQGYPLAMSLGQVEQTAPITRADFFTLSLGGQDMAAAVVFRPMDGVRQVIYWGDTPQGRPVRAMNLLAMEVAGWYAHNEPRTGILDIGPSSSQGILSPGLAQFKESVGCVATGRPTYVFKP